MPLICSSLSANIPRILGLGRGSDNFTHSHIKTSHVFCSSFLSLHHKSPNTLLTHIAFVSKFDQNFSSPVMEEEHKMFGLVSEAEEYSEELDVAVRAVQMVCSLYQKMQDTLISKPQSHNDNFPITVAGWSVKAIVSWILFECLRGENVSILAEEDVQTLSKTNTSELLEAVVKTVNECLAEGPRFGIEEPKSPLGSSEFLEIISRCNSVGGPSGRFWVLGPLDGDQYAVALSLIEDGEVVLGVLGCPNYPMRKDWFSYHRRYQRIISKLTPPTSETWNQGCVIYAKRGSGKAWIQPLLHVNKKFVWPNHAKQVSVSCIDNLAFATFCQPLEKANSSHSFTEGLALSVGLSNQTLRVYNNMLKYAAIACGDAEVFMKFARAGNKEKIWDHAAGAIIIEEAGGVVTDARGLPLDFSKGLYLERLDRGIVACSGPTLHEKIIDAVDVSWSSSCL
ncbi:PAP-specific phosphatase HAL2-like [Abrus precatorius]|uniref:3'(2'),5'-bisphosphate nucleotidase n=1 Tax=Abrus precatorius TaxID=3816 RepID=A0A8B8KTR2_ABRPR|nr:PAP-specific phosphatase HAL2-like [Abrus precatorius]